MDCPQCLGPFKDPTTFPCGHSCCMQDAQQMAKCYQCNDILNSGNLKVNYSMRDIVTSYYSQSGNTLPNNILSLLECPICFIPFIDPTTFPCGHSVCLEDAKVLQNCPICNSDLPDRLWVNVSMKLMISKLINEKTSSNPNVSVTDMVKNLNFDNNDSDDDEEDEADRENVGANNENMVHNSTDKKKKKRKPKKKKRVVTNDAVAQLFYDAKFFSNDAAVRRLEELSVNNKLALGYCTVLYFEKTCHTVDPLKAEAMATELISYLESGVSNNDKYYLFLSGIMHCIVSNSVRGLQLLIQSADLGYIPAMYWTGMFAYSLKDESKAIHWYRKAADLGNPLAQYHVGRMLKNTEGLNYLKLAASQGVHQSYYDIARRYVKGQGVTQDVNAALRYMRLGCDLGDAVAQCSLGSFYMNGTGVMVDEALAFKYFKLSADQGLHQAQCYVGRLYYYGAGIESNKEEALRYWRLSAAQGYEAARDLIEKHFNQ